MTHPMSGLMSGAPAIDRYKEPKKFIKQRKPKKAKGKANKKATVRVRVCRFFIFLPALFSQFFRMFFAFFLGAYSKYC